MNQVKSNLREHVPHYKAIIRMLRSNNITKDVFITHHDLLGYLKGLIELNRNKCKEKRLKHNAKNRLHLLVCLFDYVNFEIKINGGWDANDYDYDYIN